jgi:N-acetyldiaminopimelate deacetylase
MIHPIELREWMHANPEPAFKEYRVTSLLLKELSVCSLIQCFRPLETGLIACYQGHPTNSFTLLRADIDALPSGQDSDIDCAEHLCGHDIHTSILWSVLQKVVKEKPRQNILFLFQPGEESGDGARRILDTGILQNWNIKKSYALHVNDSYPLGSVASNCSTLFSASQEMDILFQGMQSHITTPEKGIDAWKACVLFQTKWEEQKRIDGTFLGIGRVEAGITRNTVPPFGEMYMTARASSTQKIRQLENQIKDILHFVSSTIGVKTSIKKGSSCPPVQNSKEIYENAFRLIHPHYPFIQSGMAWAAEDYGYYSLLYPSFMFWLGTLENGKKPVGLHHKNFFPSNESIDVGTRVYTTLLEI